MKAALLHGRWRRPSWGGLQGQLSNRPALLGDKLHEFEGNPIGTVLILLSPAFKQMLALSENPSIPGRTAPARQVGVSTSNKSPLVVAKTHRLFPLFVWSRLRIHQMPTVMVGIKPVVGQGGASGERVRGAEPHEPGKMAANEVYWWTAVASPCRSSPAGPTRETRIEPATFSLGRWT